MRRFLVLLVLLSALVLSKSAVVAMPGKTAFAESIGISECPRGKVLFSEQPFLEADLERDDYRNLTAAVLVKSKSLDSETYLHKRSDGWTHLSSDKTMVEPLAVVSNCLPKGEYSVRIEYFTRVPMVGDWLLGVGEYEITLEGAVLPKDTEKIAMHYPKASFNDNLIVHWPLFAVYALLTPLLFAFALIAFLRHVRNQPAGNKENAS